MAGKFESPRGGNPPRKVPPSRNDAPPPRRRRKRRRRRTNPLLLVLPVLILAVILIFTLSRCGGEEDTESTLPSITETAVPTETTEAIPQVVSTATVGAQGDLLMHKPITTAYTSEDGQLDYSPIFQYINTYLRSCDYAVANLETTFGGDSYPYQGNPRFNTPDAFMDAVAGAGYDMLLTANNHSSDTYTDGILRTVRTVRDKGVAALGTMLSEEEDKYAVVDINGIKIGMLCYTYATNEYVEGRPSLNYKEFVEQPGIVNYFMETKLDRFYSEVEQHLNSMEADGAEATILYIHWGTEYETTENATQRAIAQKMCDLGIDVIIGGHPHVLQPIELLHSNTDANHKTVCIYSLGNAVSNQMKDEDKVFASGHSEDGALFTVTFEKYSDGSVYLADTDLLPTWVNRPKTGNTADFYHILPLDANTKDQWMQLYGLTAGQYTAAQESYARTMSIITPGLTQCQTWLSQQNITP